MLDRLGDALPKLKAANIDTAELLGEFGLEQLDGPNEQPESPELSEAK
jgi:hypothetical protein